MRNLNLPEHHKFVPTPTGLKPSLAWGVAAVNVLHDQTSSPEAVLAAKLCLRATIGDQNCAICGCDRSHHTGDPR